MASIRYCQPSDWLKRPAIIWDHTKVQNASCSYWNSNILSELTSLKINGCASDEPTADESSFISSVSYQSLFLISLSLVDFLRENLLSNLSQFVEEHDNLVGVPIVVAIPEGPLLPLAILAVHVLNEPFDSNMSAVLVPIEPSEGKERLRHMLHTTKPVVILCMPGPDADLMNEIVSTVSFESNSMSSQGLLQPASCTVIDFLDFVQQAVDRIKTDLELQMICAKVLLTREEKSLQLFIQEGLQELRASRNEGTTSMSPYVNKNRMSHVVFTSGTTGQPKGCVSSISALRHYIQVKNQAYEIASNSTVFLASALSFDPCLSDILATFDVKATLAMAPRQELLYNMPQCLKALRVTHVLCTPALWSLVHNSGADPNDFPCLQVVALGGEPISKRVIAKWARSSQTSQSRPPNTYACRLFSTYGVTEACVYQTYGELFQDVDAALGPHVGIPFPGLETRLFKETNQTELEEVSDLGGIGEVVLFGAQVDEWSSYLNQAELSAQKFLKDNKLSHGENCYFYRTGDRGSFNLATGNLKILGRIEGETGMVKINGVRVELGEIESALVDDVSSTFPTVVDAISVAVHSGEETPKQIHAYCVLADTCLKELGINCVNESSWIGALCTRGPLLTLLQARCEARAKVSPSVFVLIPQIPLSPTGKRDHRKLPPLGECVTLDSLTIATDGDEPLPLHDYGTSGKVVAEAITECLNLQACQQTMLTTTVRFGLLGGDSLAATRVVRALYAYHHKVFNTRHLGGEYGTLDGPFNVVHLLRADSLKEYVDWLDANNVCKPDDLDAEGIASCPTAYKDQSRLIHLHDTTAVDPVHRHAACLYEALLEAATMGHTRVAIAMLDLGADPNYDDHGGRLGKISNRKERRKIFRSSPLHLACVKGDPLLVDRILRRGGKFNQPDASGSFPIHLAASGTSGLVLSDKENRNEYSLAEDTRRLQCVKLLLEAGAPISMKDGNKQTVLHCAARSGHSKLISFIMERWKFAGEKHEVPVYDDVKRGGRIDWMDRWFRTPVHWAILNKRIEALRILLDEGCSPDPPKVKNNRQTSAAIESPLELCMRLYGKDEWVGREISSLLEQFSRPSN